MLTLLARFLPSLLPAASALLNPWILLALVAGLGLAWFKGYQVSADKLERYRAEQFAEATRINTARAEVTERVVTRYIKVKGDTQVVTNTIEKEVIKYADANPGLCLDPAWRVLHDAAAANTIPGPARAPGSGLRAPAGAAAGLGPAVSR